jgi:hypothetical protein
MCTTYNYIYLHIYIYPYSRIHTSMYNFQLISRPSHHFWSQEATSETAWDSAPLPSIWGSRGSANSKRFGWGSGASWFKDGIGYILVVIWRGTDNHPLELGLYPIFLYFQTKPGVSRNFLWDYPPTVGYAFLANESHSEPWMRAVPCHSHGCSCSTVISCHGDIFTYSPATFPYVRCSTVDLYTYWGMVIDSLILQHDESCFVPSRVSEQDNISLCGSMLCFRGPFRMACVVDWIYCTNRLKLNFFERLRMWSVVRDPSDNFPSRNVSLAGVYREKGVRFHPVSENSCPDGDLFRSCSVPWPDGTGW